MRSLRTTLLLSCNAPSPTRLAFSIPSCPSSCTSSSLATAAAAFTSTSSFLQPSCAARLASASAAGPRPGVSPSHRRFCSAAARSDVISSSNSSSSNSMWGAVERVYDEAVASGAISSIDTQVEFFWDIHLNVEYIIRVAAALNKKPKGAAAATAAPDSASPSVPPPPSRNPFLPYEEALWVGHLSASHTLLLNKFNVLPHHLLSVTRVFESQQDPLNSRDLEASWNVLQMLPTGGVAFYNCGEHSGRSQPHKHMQIVPLPLVSGRAATMPVQLVVDAASEASGAPIFGVFEVRQLPYTCYAAKLAESSRPDQLQACFDALFQRAGGHGTTTDAAPLSYNVLMTRETMMLVPRSKETVGPVAINSLGFAGTILVRSQEDAAYVRSKGPTDMLAEVGVAWK